MGALQRAESSLVIVSKKVGDWGEAVIKGMKPISVGIDLYRATWVLPPCHSNLRAKFKTSLKTPLWYSYAIHNG